MVIFAFPKRLVCCVQELLFFYSEFFVAGDNDIVLLGSRVSMAAALTSASLCRVLFLVAGGTPPLPSRTQNV